MGEMVGTVTALGRQGEIDTETDGVVARALHNFAAARREGR